MMKDGEEIWADPARYVGRVHARDDVANCFSGCGLSLSNCLLGWEARWGICRFRFRLMARQIVCDRQTTVTHHRPSHKEHQQYYAKSGHSRHAVFLGETVIVASVSVFTRLLLCIQMKYEPKTHTKANI